MSVLTATIPQQNFELIRDRVGEILADELANQFALSSEDVFDTTVFLERFVPPSPNNMFTPYVNVMFSDTSYEFNTPVSSKGENSYNIDVYSQSSSTSTQDADQRSTFRLHRMLGAIRAILENSAYLTLGFARGFIERVTVKSIRIDEPDNNQDARATIMGRLVLEVIAAETTEPAGAVNAEGYTTTVKLSETEKGFIYIQDN